MGRRILWLSHLLPYPPIGGVRQRSYHLLKAVAEKHDVVLVALSQNAHQKNWEERKSAVDAVSRVCRKVFCFEMECDRAPSGKRRLFFRSLITGSCYLSDWVHSDEYQSQLKALVRDEHFDLVYLDMVGLGRYLAIVKEIPAVLNHHNVESQLMFRRSRNEKLPWRKFYCYQEAWKRLKMEKTYCPRVKLNICVSELDKNRLNKEIVGIGRVEVVPNVVDTSYFFPAGQEPIPNSIVFVGGMMRFPNRDAMLFFAKQIWPELKRQVNGVSMTVVGREPPGLLLKISRKDKDFIVTGFVDDVRPYLERAWVYVCPIRDGGGTRVKILDALSSGKAVVSTDIGAEGLDLTDGEHILLGRNADELVSLIKEVLLRPELRRKLEKNGRRIIEESYDFEKVGSKMNELIESVVH